MTVMTDQQAHELIGELAQIMIGYEPVTDRQLRERATELVVMAKAHKLTENQEEFFGAIRELHCLIEDIEGDA